MSNEDIHGEDDRTYLKLEDVLQEGRMYRATSSLRTDWENGTLEEDVTSNPDRPYAVHHRPHVTGFSTILQYVMEQEGSKFSTADQRRHSPTLCLMALKVGHSKDILRRLPEQHQTGSNLRTHAEVVFLFGVEIDTCDRVPAESLLKVMLTEFGFSRVTVYNNGGRSTETFSFNEKTLPLIHGVVCGIRYVYDPPIDRLVPDHEKLRGESVVRAGLPRQQRTPVQPHPQKLMKFLSAVPGWNTSAE